MAPGILSGVSVDHRALAGRLWKSRTPRHILSQKGWALCNIDNKDSGGPVVAVFEHHAARSSEERFGLATRPCPDPLRCALDTLPLHSLPVVLPLKAPWYPQLCIKPAQFPVLSPFTPHSTFPPTIASIAPGYSHPLIRNCIGQLCTMNRPFTAAFQPILNPRPQPISFSVTPASASSPTTITLMPWEAQRLMIQVLDTAWIVAESYLRAYAHFHSPPPEDSFGFRFRTAANTPRPPAPLYDPLGYFMPALLSGEQLEFYDVTFPVASTPVPPMPQEFTLPSIEYATRPRTPPIHPTSNAAPPSIVLQPPAWQTQQLMNALQQTGQIGNPHTTGPTLPHTPVPNLNPNVPANGPVPENQRLRRVPRMRRPLPRRARSAEEQQTTVVGFVVQAATGMGSAIVSGVKRLRDGLDEGRGSKRSRVD